MMARALFSLILLVLAGFIAPAEAGTRIDRVRSPGGVEAWLVEDHSVPVISLRVIFRGGAALDPADKLGLANMTASLLDDGAGPLDAQAFQRQMEDLSISLSFEDALDTFGGSLKTLSANKDAAFDLFRLAMTEPRFDTEAVERIRSGILARIRRSAADPDYLAGRLWWSRAFPDHPYGRQTTGSVETVSRIDQADLKSFVARRLARDTMYIGVVGDITPAELAPVLDRIFGNLPMQAAPYALPAVTPKAGGTIAFIERPVPQSVVLFGEAGIKRDDPDFYTAFVMNHILGGGSFSSRLIRRCARRRAWPIPSARIYTRSIGRR
jgi:zinc protease